MFAQRHFPFFDKEVLNDLSHPDKTSAAHTIIDHSQPSLSYFVLLISSTAICTLGLLQDNPSVIMGGTIISPLMWPLLVASLSIANNKTELLKKSILLIAISCIVVLATSGIITFFSPIKLLTTEIISRAEPTFFDVLVALLAGAVAGLAMLFKRISSSLAGVAIATSLLPPLSVGMIGIVLANPELARNSLLMFGANAIAITFIVAILFSVMGLHDQKHADTRIRNLLIVLALLVVVANPLVDLLKTQSFKVNHFSLTKQTIEQELLESHPKAKLTEVKLDLSKQDGLVSITFEILIPENDSFTYKEQEQMAKQLETVLQRPVNLSLTLQRSISIISQNDLEHQSSKERLRIQIMDFLEQHPAFELDNISIDYIKSASKPWLVSLVLRTNDLDLFDESLFLELKESLTTASNELVNLEIELIPRKHFYETDDQQPYQELKPEKAVL